MSKINQPLADKLQELGFSVGISKLEGEIEAKLISVKGSLTNIFRMMEARKANTLPYAKLYNSNKSNAELFSTEEGENDNWKGGSFKDLDKNITQGIDMTPFTEAKNEIQKKGLTSKLSTSIADVHPRRKRSMSEYDGEWSYDRRWDVKPFSATTKQLSPGKTIKIVCDFAISARAGASEINSYGALAWAISNTIEDTGINTEIILRYEIENLTGCNDALIEVTVKKASEYVAPSLLAATFHCLFFRRAMFSLYVTAADLLKTDANAGLGQPVQHPNRIEFTKGVLRITPNVAEATNEEITAEIIKAVTTK